MTKRTKIEKELEKQRHKKWVKNHKGDYIMSQLCLWAGIILVLVYALLMVSYASEKSWDIKVIACLSLIGCTKIMTKIEEWLGVI